VFLMETRVVADAGWECVIRCNGECTSERAQECAQECARERALECLETLLGTVQRSAFGCFLECSMLCTIKRT